MKRLILFSVWAWAFAAMGDHGPGGPLVQGRCWLDDDLQFDAGQTDGGIVYGPSSLALREECAQIARDRWGANGSSFVADVQPVSGSANRVQAECWIDDDKDFDSGQASGGTLIGRSTAEIRRECALLAKQRYGENSSSGLSNAVLVSAPAGGMLQGHCWLDDDAQFDEGQIDGGTLFGWRSLDMREECASIARERWGANGSSFVKDIVPAQGTGNLVQAECWIDDDKDFDFDQASGGTLLGYSSWEVRRECALIAKQRYGEISSSGLRNAKLVTGSAGGLVQGHCWLDDDAQFDEGQIDGGLTFGFGSLRLREECAWVANRRWGSNGSSFVKDIQPAPAGATGVTAECWIDDDKDFDFDQASGGNLFGRSSFEIRQECDLIAKQRYGENGSSGVRNVKLVP